MQFIKEFLISLSFFTRIPINIKDVDQEEFFKSMVFIPLVGLVIGICLYILTNIIKYIDYLPFESFILLFSYIYFTGGIHLDGLADTVDAIFSGREKEKIFEIMKDSRLGSFGAIALILYMMALFISFNYLLEKDQLLIFIIFPVIGRFSAIELGAFSVVSPGSGGLAKGFCKAVKKRDFFIYLILLTVLIYFIRPVILISLFLILILTFMEIYYFKKKLDGITGDQIGMTIELNSILFLFSIIIINSLI